MQTTKLLMTLLCAATLALSACSREQSDWEKARASNNTDSYELFLKKYPNGSFTAQAQARLKELTEERDWQKARDADTPDAYQSFMKQYPEGKWAEEARIRVENFSLAQAPGGTPAPGGASAAGGASSSGGSASASAANGAAPPAPPPAAAQEKPAAKSAATPTGGESAAKGGYGVQLGAFSGAKAAEKRWASLAKKYPKLLADRKHQVHATKTAKGTLYRLQVTGLGRADAASLCKSLKAKGQACVILKPATHKAAKHAHKRH